MSNCSTKLFFTLTILIAVLLASCDDSKGVQLVNQVLSRSSKIIQKKHNVMPVGSGVSMPGGPIQKLILSFSSKSLMSKAEIRKILIEATHEMVQLVNSNKEIQQYLCIKILFS